MSLHIFMVITSMHIWCSIITVNTQQSWQIAWSRIHIPQVKMGRKDINSSAPWLSQRLIYSSALPGGSGGALYISGYHQGAITFISPRDVPETGPYSNTTDFFYSFLPRLLCVWIVQEERVPGPDRAPEAGRGWTCVWCPRGRALSWQMWGGTEKVPVRSHLLFMDRNSSEQEYCRSRALSQSL